MSILIKLQHAKFAHSFYYRQYNYPLVSSKYAYVRKAHMWLKNDFSGCLEFCDNHF